MNVRIRHLLLLGLCGLASCRVVGQVLVLPILLLAWVGSLFIGSDGMTNQEELRAGGIRVDQHLVEFRIDSELNYSGTVETARTVTSPAGLADGQQASHTFDPRTQTLELEYAQVTNPDGSLHKVEPEQVITRPSSAAVGAPSFVSSVTQTVLFPQLQVGSQTRVKWRFEQRGKPVLGFNYSWRPSFTLPVEQARIRIVYKDDVPLRFDARGGFTLQESTARGERVVEAEFRGYAGQLPEKAMVSPRDLCPEFVASTMDRWETIGARFHEAVADKIESTPEIDALAAKIVGEREGLEAARAIHRWVCGNVQYVAVYLREMSGWVPHSASEVLRHGYGDCKDQFVLLASLLRARGIEAEPVLVNYDRSFVPFPIATPLQFDHCMAYLPEFDLYSNPIDPYRDLGELEVMLSNKFVVIASPEGRVGRTPSGKPDQNTYHIDQKTSIAADGRVSGQARLDFTGRPAGRLRRTLALSANVEQPADDLLASSPIGGRGELLSSDASNLELPLHCEGTWTSDIPLSFNPRLHFEVPVGLDLLNPALLVSFISDRTRKYPTLIAAIQISSRQQIELPNGYRFVSFPKGSSVKNAAGSFESRYSMGDDGQVVAERFLRIDQDCYSPEEYPALREVLLAATIDMQAGFTAEPAP